MTNNVQNMVEVTIEAAKNKKALDIVTLDISDISILADYFIICSGNSTIQVKAIADEIKVKMEQVGYVLDHVEGYKGERWILMDYKDVVVHVFHVEEREFFSMERLWADAKVFIND